MIFARHDQLDLDTYTRVAFDHERVDLDPGLLAAVDRSRGAMLAHVERGEPAYGVNTGLGLLATRAVSTDDQAGVSTHDPGRAEPRALGPAAVRAGGPRDDAAPAGRVPQWAAGRQR